MQRDLGAQGEGVLRDALLGCSSLQSCCLWGHPQSKKEPEVLGRAGTNIHKEAEDIEKQRTPTLAFPWKLKVSTYSPGRVSLCRMTKSPWLRAPPKSTSWAALIRDRVPWNQGKSDRLISPSASLSSPAHRDSRFLGSTPTSPLSSCPLLALCAPSKVRCWGCLLHPSTCEMSTSSWGGFQRLQEVFQWDVGEELPQGVPAPAVGHGDSGGHGSVVSAGQGTSVWWPGCLWKGNSTGMSSWLSITHCAKLGAVLLCRQLCWILVDLRDT